MLGWILSFEVFCNFQVKSFGVEGKSRHGEIGFLLWFCGVVYVLMNDLTRFVLLLAS